MSSLKIIIPSKNEIFSIGMDISLAKKGVKWSEKQLGEKAKNKGVYIICDGKKILYIGKTDGKTMNFGIRLRREFQKSAAQNKHTYKKLKKLKKPKFRVSIFDESIISKKIHSSIELSPIGKIRIFEQALSSAYKPDFQEEYHLKTRSWI